MQIVGDLGQAFLLRFRGWLCDDAARAISEHVVLFINIFYCD